MTKSSWAEKAHFSAHRDDAFVMKRKTTTTSERTQAMANEIVRIHIDRTVFESPSPTTGAALYALGGIEANRELFKEVDGNEEDQPIPRNDHEVRLHPDEHLYSQREFKIFVNSGEKLVAKRVLTYEEIVELAGEHVPTDPAIL